MKLQKLRCDCESCFELAELRLFPRDKPKEQTRVCWRHAPKWAKQGDPHPTHQAVIVA